MGKMKFYQHCATPGKIFPTPVIVSAAQRIVAPQRNGWQPVKEQRTTFNTPHRFSRDALVASC